MGADAAAQSDLYSAATLAGVIETTCIVLAGPRDGEMDAAQVARLDAALGSSGAQSGGGSEAASGDRSTTGWVMGGEAAVPEAKVAGRGLKRLNGVDRWHTARLAGAIALDPDGDIAALTAATAPVAGEPSGTAVMVDGAEVRLPPGLDADCAGQVPIVVAADAAAQSDLYSAATLAGVLDTTCIVLAGARGEPMSAEQQARLAAATGARSGAPDGANGRAADTDSAIEGWIVGGTAAVPDAKVAGYSLTRIGGADRWSTARLIGEAAVAQAARDVAEATTTTTEARSAGGSSGGGSARSSGGGSGGGSSRRVSSGGGGGVSRPPAVPSTGPSSGGTPAGTTTTTSTTMPGGTTPGGGTTSPTVPGAGAPPATGPGSGDTTTTTERPAVASTFTPTISVSVPQLDGTASTNIWADATFTVTLARATGAHAGCSLASEITLIYAVGDTGAVTTADAVPASLVGTTDDGTTCTYVVAFGGPPDDVADAHFAWTMAAPAADSLSTAKTEAIGIYTVGAVTFAPDATITVPSGNDGATFGIDFTSAQANCSGTGGSAVTLTYTVPTGGTTAQPDATDRSSLVAYPAGATAATDVCSYAVTFPTNENDGTALSLETTDPLPTATVTGTDQSISATYKLTLTGVAAGETFSCALQSDGAAFCWGDNNHGQTAVPDLAEGVSFAQVSAGEAHACALLTDGAIVCWGGNANAQASAPDLSGGATFTSVEVGREHSCGLKSDGTIACWGSNADGQTTVPALAAGETFTQVSAGEQHSCAIKSDRSVVCWGEDAHSLLVRNTPTTGAFTSVSAGSLYACGAMDDGAVSCWGSAGPGRVPAPAGPFVSVSAGLGHACAVKTDETVSCWGEGHDGRRSVPSERFGAVSAGRRHSCGLKPDGTVRCWGHGNFGQVSAPSATFAVLSSGWYYNCGITTDGDAQCWGNNGSMQATVPTLGAGESFTQVSSGTAHTCGVKAGGMVACWGDDGPAEFASLTGRVSRTPTGATNLFASVTAGGTHSCGIRSGGATDGQVVCWGSDLDDQLTPPALGVGETFTTVDAGTDHTCALKSDMSVVCWGYDGLRGGDGRVSDAPSGATDRFSSLSVSDEHACAVRAADGSLACWGKNTQLQLTAPTGAFSAVAAGGEHTCGIRSGGAPGDPPVGTVVCWGSNAAGQTDAPEGTFEALTAGRFHTCGIRSGGASGGAAGGAAGGNVVCWGAGTAWQIVEARPPRSS